MICKNCGGIVKDGASFCPNCGNKAVSERTCPACGSVLKSDALFCNNCGNGVAPTVKETAASKVTRPEKKSRAGLIAVVIILVLLIVGAIGGGIYYAVESGFADTIAESLFGDEENYEEEEERETEKPRKKVEEVSFEEDEYIDEAEVSEEVPVDEKAEEKKEYEFYDGEVTSSNPRPAATGRYLYPSDVRYITESELNSLSREDIALIRNEIYARHGYIFQTEPYKSYFNAKDWYIPNPNFNVAYFNDIETANKDFIIEYESKMGWR